MNKNIKFIIERNPKDWVFPITYPKHTFGYSIEEWENTLNEMGIKYKKRSFKYLGSDRRGIELSIVNNL